MAARPSRSHEGGHYTSPSPSSDPHDPFSGGQMPEPHPYYDDGGDPYNHRDTYASDGSGGADDDRYFEQHGGYDYGEWILNIDRDLSCLLSVSRSSSVVTDFHLELFLSEALLRAVFGCSLSLSSSPAAYSVVQGWRAVLVMGSKPLHVSSVFSREATRRMVSMVSVSLAAKVWAESMVASSPLEGDIVRTAMVRRRRLFERGVL